MCWWVYSGKGICWWVYNEKVLEFRVHLHLNCEPHQVLLSCYISYERIADLRILQINKPNPRWRIYSRVGLKLNVDKT